MALENKTTLVQFGYGFDASTSKTAGMLSFDSSKQAIYVGDGTKANLVSSGVKDATYADSVLTIFKIDGTQYKLDFSDVASAAGVSSLLGNLRKDVEVNKTAINNLDTTINNLDSSYKAADASINEKIGGNFDATNTVAKAIEDAKNAAIAAGTVVTEDSDFISVEVSGETGGTQTYTIKTNDVASAATLADVSVAVTNNKKEFDTYKTTTDAALAENSSNIDDVSSRLDAFLNGEGVANTVDTLKDIQAWINGEGVNATELTEAIAAEASTRSSEDTKLSNRIDVVSAVADAAAVKTTTDTSLNLKADKAQVATDISNAKNEAITTAAQDASQKAGAAETNAKAYADKIKVNGVSQVSQDITITGVNVKVGGTDEHKDSTISASIEDLYSKVELATESGVLSFAISNDSSKYASVNKSTGAVTFTINKVTLEEASETKTGVADAYDVKTTINTTKTQIIGSEGDASTASTIYGAKKLATELNDAMDTRVTAVESQLTWNVLS